MPEIRPRQKDRVDKVRVSPVDRMIAKLDGDYYKLNDVAMLLGVAPITLRRLLKKESVNAPSYEAQMGGMYVYLYTAEDIDELKGLLMQKGS